MTYIVVQRVTVLEQGSGVGNNTFVDEYTTERELPTEEEARGYAKALLAAGAS